MSFTTKAVAVTLLSLSFGPLAAAQGAANYDGLCW